MDTTKVSCLKYTFQTIFTWSNGVLMFPAEGAEDAGDCEVVDVVASHVFVGTRLPKTWLGFVEDDIGIEVT